MDRIVIDATAAAAVCGAAVVSAVVVQAVRARANRLEQRGGLPADMFKAAGSVVAVGARESVHYIVHKPQGAASRGVVVLTHGMALGPWAFDTPLRQRILAEGFTTLTHALPGRGHASSLGGRNDVDHCVVHLEAMLDAVQAHEGT